MVIIEANGGFHLKGYAKVSFKDGKPLEKLRADGTPLRVQQSSLSPGKMTLHVEESLACSGTRCCQATPD